MGMFDTVFCDMELPDGFQNDESFQSKDLGLLFRLLPDNGQRAIGIRMVAG